MGGVRRRGAALPRFRGATVPSPVRIALCIAAGVGAYVLSRALDMSPSGAAGSAVLFTAALALAPLFDPDPEVVARRGEELRPTMKRSDDRRLCVCVPTFNEAENLARFVTALLEVFDVSGLDGTVLVIDDASPDGTGVIADELAASDSRIRVLHRTAKNGIGPAYRAGFAWALAHRFELVAQMDCDLSHDPSSLPVLVAATRDYDLAIGSRYVDGGSVVGWPLGRRVISELGSLYARTILGLPVHDMTGGFKCFHSDVLDAIDPASAHANGYGFQVELTHRAVRAGFSVCEVPIVFRDRTAGRSKMSLSIAVEAALLVLQLRLREPRPQVIPRLRAAHLIAVVVAVGLLALVIAYPLGTLETLLALLFTFLTIVGVTTLTWMLDAWRDEESLQASTFPAPKAEPELSYSLIVPARHEEQVLGATLEQLALQDYPDFEVIVVVGDDDPGTHLTAQRAIAADRRFRIVVDRNAEKSKPKALNTALPFCRGDVVGVFDAEDIVATGLLRAVDGVFRQAGADIVQGATQLVNHDSSWFSARNALEYYFWFKSRLHFHSRAGFIPLGGNTVFVRRSWLLASDGWDDRCLAEDCDLGTRMSVRGARTAVAYTAELATREETPETVRALIRQRTRWSQGFLQVLRKGDWRLLPWPARVIAFFTLSFPIVQAMIGLLLPVTIAVAIGLHLPIELGLLSFLPLVPLIAILAVEVAGLASLRSEFGLRVRFRDHIRLVLSTVPYQLLLSVAAIRAAWRELRGRRDWEKTAHVGAHL